MRWFHPLVDSPAAIGVQATSPAFLVLLPIPISDPPDTTEGPHDSATAVPDPAERSAGGNGHNRGENVEAQVDGIENPGWENALDQFVDHTEHRSDTDRSIASDSKTSLPMPSVDCPKLFVILISVSRGRIRRRSPQWI